MEHLMKDAEEEREMSADGTQVAEHRLLKRELILAAMIMLFLSAVLAGLTWYDATSSTITDIAEKVTNFVQ